MQKSHKPSFIASLFGRSKKKPPKVTAASARPFQSVGIYHGTVCCEAAREVEGLRFHLRRAPPLPLTECTMRKNCECRYMKFQDRRGSARRSPEFGIKSQLFAAQEKRNTKGRRLKD